MITFELTRTIESELQAIAEQNRGQLPARAVVAWARENVDSALHNQFTWDDTEAAEKWRLHQARTIILRVHVTTDDGKVTRAWVNLPSDRASDEPVYRPIVRVMSDADLRAELLQTVKDELVRIRRKHAELNELASVSTAIDVALEAN